MAYFFNVFFSCSLICQVRIILSFLKLSWNICSCLFEDSVYFCITLTCDVLTPMKIYCSLLWLFFLELKRITRVIARRYCLLLFAARSTITVWYSFRLRSRLIGCTYFSVFLEWRCVNDSQNLKFKMGKGPKLLFWLKWEKLVTFIQYMFVNLSL